jgi:monovalent cation:H+ antiporter, CPA1 family
MHPELRILLLFLTATAVALVARHFRLPYTVALVLAGLGLGNVKAFETLHLTKDLLFAVFLPGLVFEAAFHIEFAEFWRNRRAVLALAVPGVAASVALTALILTPVVGALGVAATFDWRYALVFAAVIAATDPIAVVSLFRSLGAPKRLGLLVESESLLNDGTAVVFFTLVLAFVTGTKVTALGMAFDFTLIVGAGAAVGVAVGLAASYVIRWVDDAMLEITVTTLAAYGSFLAAEQFHVSGVIATVAAGLVCGNFGARTGMSPTTRVAVEVFWEYLAFALNSLVFLLIGFEVRLSALLDIWPAILAAFLAVTAGRGVVVATVGALLRRTGERIPASWLPVLTWGGLRGGLSMVLALGLPADLPNRELLITLTFGVVILSILLQGLTMAPLLRRLGLAQSRAPIEAYETARLTLQLTNASLAELDALEASMRISPDAAATLRESYAKRARTAETTIATMRIERSELLAAESDRAVRHLLLAEKDQLIAAKRSGDVGTEVFEVLVADADARLIALESGES